MSRPEIERQGLLQPEEFDIDDAESADPHNGHLRNASHDWSKTRKGRSSLPARWMRPRVVICILATLAVLLMLGVALNKGAGIKIPKLIKPSPPSVPDSSTPPNDTAEQPIPPEPVKKPDSPKAPEEVTLPDIHTSSVDLSSEAVSAPATSTSIPTSAISKASSASEPSSTSNSAPKSSWEKPTDTKIIGLIFYGRHLVVAILDCYLRKNLVSNGGWLDEVQFVVNTDNEDDIAFLDKIVKEVDEYTKIKLKGDKGYNEIWKTVKAEHMYIKIDDDIVYFEDDAIPKIVYSKMHHNNSLNVVANLINSPETGWIHYRIGAIHSYLPELDPPKDAKPESLGPTAWRASKLPFRKGKKLDWPVTGVNNGKNDDGGVLPSDNPGAPPFNGHRWLPLPNGEEDLDKTPMWESSYDPNGPDWGSWSLGAQAHYSFLENLEKDQLHLYYYGHGIDPAWEGIWNMMYFRMNINFMAIWGKDVLDNLPFQTFDDEKELSMTITKKLRRPLLINTHAIAAHFSFRSQHELFDTDLLDRYRAYANEKICTKDNQIPYIKVTT